MNLRGIANSVASVVNPNIAITYRTNSGYTTDAAGHRTPLTTDTALTGQVQALTGDDLKHIDGLNMQGVFRSVYLYGNIQGVVRSDGKGGDVLRFPQVPGGAVQNWLVSQVMETWPTWCRVIVCLQV